MEKTVSAVLVAAGSSTRMGFDKLSFDLGGETVLHRSIRAFAQCPQITELVLVAGKIREFVAQQAADCPKTVQKSVCWLRTESWWQCTMPPAPL